MKINIHNSTSENIKARLGDVITYHDTEYGDYDYFMIVLSLNRKSYGMLRLKDGSVVGDFSCLDNLMEYAKKPRNDYRLYEIIKSDELELRRL